MPFFFSSLVAFAARRRDRNSAFALLLLLLFANSCKDAGTVSSSRPDEGGTLNSLTRVNNHPLYTMKFYGDYGFAQRVGLSKGQQAAKSLDNNPLCATKARRHKEKEEKKWSPLSPWCLSDFVATLFDRPHRTNSIILGDSAWGCTCFVAYGNPANPQFGRNFDWHDCIPLLLFTNPPNGYASVSIVDLEYLGYNRANLPDGGGDKTALLETPWYPFDGMNEKGVTVGMMAVSSAQAPNDPKKISLGELGTIRLILDFASSTDEAIALLGAYNLRMEDPPIHYLIADAGGHSAVIEYINGTMSVLKNSEPWHVSTNFIITGSAAPAVSPCWRYNTAYAELRAANGVLTTDRALSLLSKVSQETTIWSVVYGISAGTAQIATDRRFEGVLKFSLKDNLPPK